MPGPRWRFRSVRSTSNHHPNNHRHPGRYRRPARGCRHARLCCHCYCRYHRRSSC
ncbi:hypothetical protein HMPREF0072_0642 [Anaerococcus lactolyticus ATCC 51172]|uniref:Uncharacterized protein n=1 Tax=Anaerococcus lactolyticus ATCC 51172 TaxID=525254 RepID=C2BE72_9FIRM|nr:hypothetical protein HMPREF0072_0642 [Anaerococcus lactolyticus ATCC 51172]